MAEEPGKQEQKQPEKQAQEKKESELNRIARENKDLLWIGTRVGIYLVLCLILIMATKMAVMQQVQWAEDHCGCQDWGGDAFTLTTQQHRSNATDIMYSGMIVNGTNEQG